MAPQIIGPALNEIRRYLMQPACPRCGDTLMAAAGAELAARGYVRNCWSCDSCGYDFVTAVRVPDGVAAIDDPDER